MARFHEQRAVVELFLLGTETLAMLKNGIHKDKPMRKTQMLQFSFYKNVEMSIDNKPSFGHPSTTRMHENVEKIREIIMDRRRTIKLFVELSGVIWSSFQRIFTTLRTQSCLYDNS
ncbi:HTH_48 domain-containing protein [Trichonephila inaurata madagascariensis]|uniref:HTH_48 domain-containing protein n=1 Tax=Trichonephila inaurata madagascariensis TaxID=2747483 RepID=A0A8X6YD50_9ARAC|nr:HTH_48 domain-containing protein [Trichonephila inaurata madagascariensis]